MDEKRKDYISWDEYFMGVAILSSQRSKDPSTQVGACIASPSNKVVTMGYNGMPIGINDDDLPWSRSATSPFDNKYFYVCHAEFNAILNSNAPVKDLAVMDNFACFTSDLIDVFLYVLEDLYDYNEGDSYYDSREEMFNDNFEEMIELMNLYFPNVKVVTDYSKISK